MVVHITGNAQPIYGSEAHAVAMQQMLRMFPDMHVNTPYPIQFRNGDWITVVTHATGVTGGANPGAVRRIHPGCSFLPGLVFRQTSVPSVPFPISSIGQEGNGNAVTGSQAAGSS